MNRKDALARHFDSLYQADHDPWQVRERWYEQRKRAILLASLPRRHYARAYEPGCGNGELTAALMDRCGHVLAADGSPAALARARQRLAARGADEGSNPGACGAYGGAADHAAGSATGRRSGDNHDAGHGTGVTLALHAVPQDWPDEQFDLIVISELAYYLDQTTLNVLARRCAASLAGHGTLLLCHWKPPFADRVLSTDQAHATFRALPRMRQLLRHEEDDFLLEILSPDARSVASLGDEA